MVDPKRAEPHRAPPDQSPADALQDAALAMIAAARTFLSAAEDAVRDPSAVREMAGTVTSMARSFLRVVVPSDHDGADAKRSADPVEHLDVS